MKRWLVFYVRKDTDTSAQMIIEAETYNEALRKAEVQPNVYHVADIVESEV